MNWMPSSTEWILALGSDVSVVFEQLSDVLPIFFAPFVEIGPKLLQKRSSPTSFRHKDPQSKHLIFGTIDFLVASNAHDRNRPWMINTIQDSEVPFEGLLVYVSVQRTFW
jgi:hypothetical protein